MGSPWAWGNIGEVGVQGDLPAKGRTMMMTRLTLHWCDILSLQRGRRGGKGLGLSGLTLCLSIVLGGFLSSCCFKALIFSFLFSPAHFFFGGEEACMAQKVGNFAIIGPHPRLLGVTS